MGQEQLPGDITRDNVRPFVQYHFPSVTNQASQIIILGLLCKMARGDTHTQKDIPRLLLSQHCGMLHEQGIFGVYGRIRYEYILPVYNDGPKTRRNVNLQTPKLVLMLSHHNGDYLLAKQQALTWEAWTMLTHP